MLPSKYYFCFLTDLWRLAKKWHGQIGSDERHGIMLEEFGNLAEYYIKGQKEHTRKFIIWMCIWMADELVLSEWDEEGIHGEFTEPSLPLGSKREDA